MVDPSENILRKTKHPVRFAVLELSTRACKLLIADIGKLQHGFRWNAFQNKSQLSSTGLLLKQNNTLLWSDFEKHVLPIIRKHIITAKSLRVDRLFCVATAALRQATNRDEILSKTQNALGLRIHILSPSEEAHATIQGYIWKEKHKGLSKPERHFLIDQGGGSTEITAFNYTNNDVDIHHRVNINIGTASIIQSFLLEPLNTPIREALWNTLRTQSLHFEQEFKSFSLSTASTIIGVGSAVTKATGKLGNKKQHGTILSKEILAKQKRRLEETFATQYKSLAELRTALYHPNDIQGKKLQEALTWYFGLGMYLEMLRFLQQETVTVNGAGLRYGICYSKLNIRYPKLEDGGLGQYFTQHAFQIDGLSEKSYVEGTVANIDGRFGIFVRLNAKHTGLVHIKQLRHKKMTPQNFRKGDKVNVFINAIKKKKKQFHFYLDFCSIIKTNKKD